MDKARLVHDGTHLGTPLHSERNIDMGVVEGLVDENKQLYIVL